MPPYLRGPKLLLSLLAGLALLLGLAYVVLDRLFPPERLAALLSAQVSAATGRDFTVRGRLSIRLLPSPGVAAEDVALGNAPWGSRKDMLLVRQARFDIALWPLLRGQLDIASVSFEGVDLLLETDRQGDGNWVLAGTAGEPPAGGGGSDGRAPRRVQLSSLRLADTQLAYRDGRSGTTRSLRLQALALDSAGDGQTLDAAFDSSGQRWHLKGRIGHVAELSNHSADWPFDLQLTGDGAVLGAKGQLRQGALPRPVQAEVSAHLTRSEALAPWLPKTARIPLPIELKGRLNHEAPSLRIDNLQLSLAQQQFSGQLVAQSSNPWRVDAQLASPSIDLARWLPPRSAAAGAPAGGDRRVFGDAPLGLDALPAGPATLALRVDKLLMPGLPPLSNLNVKFDAQPGRFRADPFSVGLAGGTLHGSLAVAQGGGGSPRVNLQAQGSQLSLDTLLQASGHSAYARGGQLQLRADLNLAGGTARALATAANGELRVSLSNTTLGSGASPLGTDPLRQVLQAVTLRSQPAVASRIECAVLRLPLKNGVATVDRSIALETEQLALSAKGEIRFDDETLELAFRPTPKRGLNLNPAELTQLVVLKGPWQAPKLALDAQGVVGMAASLGLAGATGGLSMLAKQLLQSPPQTQACREAMGLPVQAAAPATPAPAATPQRLPQGVPEVLRKLFK